MNKVANIALGGGLSLNQRLSVTAANSVDWLFKRDTLIKSGRTWFELVHDSDLMCVRHYTLPDDEEIQLVDGSTLPIERKQYPVPLVLVPPLGVTTETFDLLPERSLVRYMVARGFDVYLIDWGKPRKEHAHLGLEDYADRMMSTALGKIRRHSGREELSMMGWCMGGLLCLFYQGIHRDADIRNIVTVASPIDPHAGTGLMPQLAAMAQRINGSLELVSNYTNLRLNTLDPARLSFPDWLTALVFKMTDPVSSVTTYFDLITRLGDRQGLESYSTTSDYLNNMLRYPGGVMKEMTSGMLGKNQIASGKFQLANHVADITSVASNLLAFGGETDNLVPVEVAAHIVEVVASADKEFRVAPGGHMGVILGSKAQGAVWKESADWLAERSAEKPPGKRRKTAGKKAAGKKAAAKKPAAKGSAAKKPAAKKAAAKKASTKKAATKKAAATRRGAKARAKAKPKPRR